MHKNISLNIKVDIKYKLQINYQKNVDLPYLNSTFANISEESTFNKRFCILCFATC